MPANRSSFALVPVLRPFCTTRQLRRGFAATAAWLIVGALPAQQPGVDFAVRDAAAARTSVAFQEFAQAAGGTWWTRWCPATGTPMEIFGSGLPIADWRGSSLEEARRQANAALGAHGKLLGLGTDEFREVIGAAFGNVWSFTFAQFHGGLPVLGGRADVRIHQTGRISFLGSLAFAVPADLPLQPAIDDLEAERIAWLALGKARQQALPGAPRSNRLVLWGDVEARAQAPVFLCWEIPVDALDVDGNGPIGRYYVDASNGVVRHYQNDKHECGIAGCRAGHGRDGHGEPVGPAGRGADVADAGLPPATYTVMGWARDSNTGAAAPTNVPLPGIEVVVPGRGTLVTDAQGQFTVNLSAAANVTVRMNGIHYQQIAGTNAPAQAATLQPGVASTIQVLTSGASSNQLAHTTCALWTHRVNEWARSILGNSAQLAQADNVLPTVNIAATCNAYYTGNTINFYASGGGCNNTASSSVVAHEWGHGLDDRYGGISQVQGLSEAWGDICSEYLLDDPIIGAGFFTSGAGIRTGLNGTMYPPPGEVHAAGEVFMGFAWLFRENLRAAFGTAQAIALSNSLVVGSIAANAIDQPAAVTQIFLADDNDGDATNGTPHYNQLEPACLQKGLPYPRVDAGSITLLPVSTANEQLLPRFVTATVVPRFGSFTQVEVVYNDGSVHRRRMIGTGNANEYQGLLPGPAAPATVSWHVEATHSTGVIVRLPATSEFSYEIFVAAPFYLEDFEGSTAGWTHGVIGAGVDDWEIGAPAGLGGLGWSDPAAAYSGTICAGTDLTGDGTYADGTETFLRSPPIDCTGVGGLRLRFRRWLTVDSLLHDMAQIRLNGALIWINPFVPIVDSSWTLADVPIPIANGSPAVELEWRIRSDASGALGGWAIDDVQIVSSDLPAPLPNRLQILPEQGASGTPMTLSLHTQVPSPFLLLIGDAPGPLPVPGLPTLQLAGNIIVALSGSTNAAGDFSTGFTVPPGIPATGIKWFSQALALDATGQIVGTNGWITLLTP